MVKNPLNLRAPPVGWEVLQLLQEREWLHPGPLAADIERVAAATAADKEEVTQRLQKREWSYPRPLIEAAETTAAAIAKPIAAEVAERVAAEAAKMIASEVAARMEAEVAAMIASSAAARMEAGSTERIAAAAAKQIDSTLHSAIEFLREEAEKALQSIHDEIAKFKAARRHRRNTKEEIVETQPHKSQQERDAEAYLRHVGCWPKKKT